MKRLKSLVAGFAVLVVAFGAVLPVFAATSSSSSSSSLSIAPKKNYVIEPGKSVSDKLTIRNLDSTHELLLTLRVVDFSYSDDSGTPKLMLDKNSPQTTWSLRSYLTLPESVTIAPGGSKTVDMGVKIPAGHGAGSYYSAIVYSSGAGSGGNVGLSASGVTLVFVTIPGAVTENLKLEKFGAYTKSSGDKQSGYIYFTMQDPQYMAYTLKNDGNVTEAPTGSITLKDWWGHQYVITDLNPTGSLALIGQTRTFTTCVKYKAEEVDFNGTKTQSKECTASGLWPGYYSATLNLLYGQNGNATKEVNGRAGFWYFPIWFVILLIAVAAGIAYLVWRIKRKFGGGKSYRTRSNSRSSSMRRGR